MFVHGYDLAVRTEVRICDTPIVPGGGGGTHLSTGYIGGAAGGGGGGVKTWPCLKPLGGQKIHPVTIYLTKNFHMHTLLRGGERGREFRDRALIQGSMVYWYGRTLYSAVYHHTFIKTVASRTHRRWCRDREPVINIVGWEATLW